MELGLDFSLGAKTLLVVYRDSEGSISVPLLNNKFLQAIGQKIKNQSSNSVILNLELVSTIISEFEVQHFSNVLNLCSINRKSLEDVYSFDLRIFRDNSFNIKNNPTFCTGCAKNSDLL